MIKILFVLSFLLLLACSSDWKSVYEDCQNNTSKSQQNLNNSDNFDNVMQNMGSTLFGGLTCQGIKNSCEKNARSRECRAWPKAYKNEKKNLF